MRFSIRDTRFGRVVRFTWVLLAVAIPHPVSAQERTVCDLCFQPVGNRFYIEEGTRRSICETCRRTRPRCYSCGILLAARDKTVEGQPLCDTCYRQRPRCDDCGNPILLHFYEVSGASDVYCRRCFDTHPHCPFCGRPFSPANGRPTKDQPVCDRCASQVVGDVYAVQVLYVEIADWLATEMKMQISSRVRISLVASVGQTVQAPLLDSYSELGAYQKQGDRETIEILKDLPEPLLCETLAHELAHAWQEGKAPSDQRLLLKEGFAQWVASKALIRFGYAERVAGLRARKDLYGEGLRFFERVEARRGTNAVLQYARETR